MNGMSSWRLRGLCLLVAFWVGSSAMADVIYVDVDATGDDDGTSWTDAYADLQDALTDADSDGVIWVAAGTYYPTSGSDRTETFMMANGVEIYGGFAGTEDPATFDLDDRDFETNETILSGDIDSDGILDDDNSYHVVTASSKDETAVLDGFTIKYGNASDTNYDMGGGMFMGYQAGNPNPTVRNCVFEWNSARAAGGAVQGTYCSMTLENCRFSNNTAGTSGGAIRFYRPSTPRIVNCIFTDNTLTSGVSNYCGGAIYLWTYVDAEIINCTFGDNSTEGTTAGKGGAICCRFLSDATITNCLFYGNTTDKDGGAISCLGSSPTITNCTFSGNVADYDADSDGVGGALSADTLTDYAPTYYYSSPTIENSILWDNEAYSDNEIYVGSGWNSVTVAYSDVEGGYTGTENINSDPEFANASNDDYHLTSGSPCIGEGHNPYAVAFSDTTSDTGTSTTIEVDDASDFVVGDEIEIDSDGILRTVTDVDTTNEIVTFTPALDSSSGSGKDVNNYGSGDLDGNDRVIGGNVDMGAYENPVASRHIFYNDSAYDGDDSSANSDDDDAIDTSKEAYLPGSGTATFDNYIAYDKGINGIMIDIQDLPGTPTSSDFSFKYGNDDSPGDWTSGPTPTSVSVRSGAGEGGSDRVTIIFDDNDVPNESWLEVTVEATTNTGLAADDVHYWGLAIGETGNLAGNTIVNVIDVSGVRANLTQSPNVELVTNVWDIDKNELVETADENIILANLTLLFEHLVLINIP